MNSESTIRSSIHSKGFLWSPTLGLAAGTLLAAVAAFAPRLAAQTVGPIRPSGSATPAEQTPRAAPPPAPAAVAKTNLAGSWKLNRDDSDDPQEKMREATNNSGMNNGGQGGGGRRTGGWGMGGPGLGGPGMGQGPWGGGGGQSGGGSRGNNGQDDTRNAATLSSTMDMSDLSALAIDQSDAATKVTGATGRILAAYSSSNPDATNKPPSNKSSDDSTYVPPAAQLQGGQLVVVTPERQRGAKTTRTYALSDDRTQLWVTTKIENPRFSQPVIIRLVYDQAKPASGA